MFGGCRRRPCCSRSRPRSCTRSGTSCSRARATRRRRRRSRCSTAEVVFAVPAWLTWRMDRAVWPYLVASGVLAARLLRAARHGVPRGAALGRLPDRARRRAGARARRSASSCSATAPRPARSSACCLVGAGILLVRGLRPSVGRGVALRARDRVRDRDVHARRQARRHATPARCRISSSRCSRRRSSYAAVVARAKGRPALRASFGRRPSSPGSPRSARTASCCSRSSAPRQRRRRRARDECRRDGAARGALPGRAGRADADRRRGGRRLRDRARLAHVDTPEPDSAQPNPGSRVSSSTRPPRGSRIRFRERIWFALNLIRRGRTRFTSFELSTPPSGNSRIRFKVRIWFALNLIRRGRTRFTSFDFYAAFGETRESDSENESGSH